MKKLIIIFLVVTLLFSSCSYTAEPQQDKNSKNQKFVGVWFTYKEIEELCNNCSSIEELEESIRKILVELKQYKINNIFLHSRAFDDCFYNSSIFSVSDYCKNEHGELKFDILHHFIELAKEHGIFVHAWINPYRIRNDAQIDKIPKSTLAGKILSENRNDERVIVTDNSIYYNPAYPEVQNYVLSGIREILQNYDVCGIHIDDYFYPTTNEEIDKKIYNNYLNEGGEFSLADFRRNAVNTLVSSIYSLVKSFNNDILFSISPSADIEKNYSNSYADVKLWSQNEGYADILIPQLYYGFNHSTMPFNSLLSDWIALQSDTVKIVIGLAVYKAGTEDVYAKEGSDEWLENDNIISKQIYYLNTVSAHGWAYFSSSYLYKNLNENIEREKRNIIASYYSIWKE